jgi:hypothetical protein
MHKYANFLITLLFTVLAISLFSGCDQDDDDNSSNYDSSNDDSSNNEEEHEHEDTRNIFFYNSETNTHLAYSIPNTELIDLNQEMHGEHNISNFNMSSTQSGKPFIWLDYKGDENASNDEEKIVMFKSDFNFDNNVTWEDFYYLGHFHTEDDGSNSLAAHSNLEFNVTAGAKVSALIRLNKYIDEQQELKSTFETKIGNNICGVYTNIDDEDFSKTYFVMQIDGKLKIYDESKSLKDEIMLDGITSCDSDQMGMSGVEGGIWLFLADTQKIYEVDSHDDGVYHVHQTLDISEYTGDKNIKAMVSIKPLD